jgi:hypothetical protein
VTNLINFISKKGKKKSQKTTKFSFFFFSNSEKRIGKEHHEWMDK